ncbi:hypothetical protein DRN63_03785 [Nanoarchaeota archaeon]|nr:MAG: hypothetical protein DRN63_03785 [Nanoarchaeota archaeon]
MSQGLYERLKLVIEKDLRIFRDDRIRAIKWQLLREILFMIVIPAFLVVLAYIFGGMIASLITSGLAAINFADRLQKGYTILKSYHSDIEAIKKWYDAWVISLKSIELNDEEKLKCLQDELLESMKRIREETRKS